MTATVRPASLDDLRDVITDAAGGGAKLEIRGGGAKADVGAPHQATVLDMAGFAGVIDYDPAELVLTAGAATPLAEIQALVTASGQMLAFDPFDYAPILGGPAGASTLGGVIGAATAGSRRLSRGGVRDHLLGFQGVSGRGEVFTAGAKVVKNVTGYDLPKVLAGSWGRLAALTEVTLKVLPAPRERATRAIAGLNPVQAQAAMARAMGSQADVAAAAHIPAVARPQGAITLLRIEGFGPSVTARGALLDTLLADIAPVIPLADEDAASLWDDLRTLSPLADAPVLWRINVPPSAACALVAALDPLGARWLFDWAGGLVWLGWDGEARQVRDLAQAAGGHATLMRAPQDMRARIPALHPQAAGVARLEARVRRAFDPAGVFETGRFLDAADAD